MPVSLLKKIRDSISQKKVFIPLGLGIIILAFFLARGTSDASLSIVTPEQGTLKETVRATGQVASSIDFKLSFNTEGIVRSVPVSVGSVVVKDQILATLDGRSEEASVMQARGALLSAQAKMKRTNEDVLRARVLLKNAERDLETTRLTQDALVSSAFHALLNSTPEAFSSVDTNDYELPTISGTYKLGKEGSINVNGYYSNGGSSFTLSGLTTGAGMMRVNTPQPLGDSGLYIVFPTTNLIVSDWTIPIPNKKAPDYLTNLNAYNNALKNRTQAIAKAQALVDERELDLSIKKDPAYSGDEYLARADILSAEGGLALALSKYEDTIIRAPEAGTITDILVEYGEKTTPSKEALVLQDIDNVYIEALINESNITTIKVGQAVDVSLDAFSKSTILGGVVKHIDPAAVTNDGVVNYKIKIALTEKNPLIRPGMNAEVTIIAKTKENVLYIPKASITTIDGESYVYVLTNEKRKTSVKKRVTLGMSGDGNRVEILSGLSRGDRIVLGVKD